MSLTSYLLLHPFSGSRIRTYERLMSNRFTVCRNWPLCHPYIYLIAGSGIRTHDLWVMNSLFLPSELFQLIIIKNYNIFFKNSIIIFTIFITSSIVYKFISLFKIKLFFHFIIIFSIQFILFHPSNKYSIFSL